MNDSSNLAEWILEQTADAVVYADAAGRIVRWNQAACSLFGYTSAEALGHTLDLIIPQHLRAAHGAGFSNAMASGRTRLTGRPTLTRAVPKDGNRLYVEMTFAVVRDDMGKVVGAVAVARNATERVERDRSAARQPSGK